MFTNSYIQNIYPKSHIKEHKSALNQQQKGNFGSNKLNYIKTDMKAKFYDITCDMQEKERPFRQECRALRFAFIRNI